MENVNEDRNCAGIEEQEQMDVASVFRVIFCSCDAENAGLVPVSKLIEFVQPFMIEDLISLNRHPKGHKLLTSLCKCAFLTPIPCGRECQEVHKHRKTHKTMPITCFSYMGIIKGIIHWKVNAEFRVRGSVTTVIRNALEDLRQTLDPEGKNALVSSEHFYQVMGLWSQKIAATSSNEESEFNRSPSRLQVMDEKELPYTHSTPRASIGDKLLKCKDLLNLSNVSGYSLSTSRLDTTNPTDSDKTVLEEEIKKLEHQLSKTANELTLTKQQLTAFEEQNETLQQDLDRLSRRLQAEQQVNEHLQKEKNTSEDLREELISCKKVIEDLKKKLSQSEKDSMYHKEVIDEQDNEKLKLEKRIQILSKQHQDSLKEIFDVKTELETKEQEMTDVIKVYDELKLKFAEQKDFNDQLREENDILSHQKSTLEKALKAKSFNSPHSNLGNLNFNVSNSSSTSPPYNTQNTAFPLYSSPNLANHHGVQPKCQSVPLLRRVLGRHSSTPVNLSHSLLDSSLPDSVKSVPVLSPVYGAKQEEGDQHQNSSEEDLSWKLQQGEAKMEGQDLNGTAESLHTEMYRADPKRMSETYHTVLFEKDEQIIELEEELEKIKTYLKEIEDQKNEFLSKLKDQTIINNELMENNFVLLMKETSSQTKIESLKNRLSQLEKNGVIVENDHENSHGEIEDLRNKTKILEEEIKSKEFEIKELKADIEKATKETSKLKEKLREAETRIEDYDERLQTAMRDFGEVSVNKASAEERLERLVQENLNISESNAQGLEEMLDETKNLKEKLFEMEQLNKDVSDKNKLLEDENFVLNHDLECAKSQFEHLNRRFVFIEEELSNSKDLNNKKDQEIARCEDDKKQMAYKFEEKLRLKDEEIKTMKTLVDKQLELEDGLRSSLSKLSSKSRSLAENENKVKFLSNIEKSLKQEIESLKASKTELETTVKKLMTEQEDLYFKLQKVNKIDVVASEIQKHIKDKDIVIEELKQLNKKMEYSLHRAELDITGKVDEILKLRNEWSKGIDIKNDLWSRVKSLQKRNHHLEAENRELLEKERHLSSSSESLNIEYNNLLMAYDLEVSKNFKFEEQIAQVIEEKNQFYNRYNELKEEFNNSVSKFDSKNKSNLENIGLSLSECQAKLYLLESQNQELREQISNVPKNDTVSQTEAFETEDLEFLKIKVESDKLLEELESRLNEEVNKNEDLAKDLLELRKHLDNRNTELLEMKQKITDTETDMVAKLQHYINKNNELVEELAQTNESLHAKDVELSEFINRVNTTEKELQILNEKYVILGKELTDKCEKLENMERKIHDYEEMQEEIGIKNAELLKKLTDVETLLEQRQEEMRCIENNNRLLTDELTLKKKDKDKINNELLDANSQILLLKEEISELYSEKNMLVEQNKVKITDLEHINGKLHNELIKTKQEKEDLNNKQQDAASELIQLKEKLCKNEEDKNRLLYEMNQKLLEEVAKNKAIFDKFSLLKQERDQLTLELNDMKMSLSDMKTLHDKKQSELKDLQVICLQLNEKIQKTTEQLRESEVLLKDEAYKNDLEKDVIITELSSMKSSLVETNMELKNREIELSKTKKELDIKCVENKRLSLELEEAKRKLSNADGSTCSNSEKETCKRKTYSRQQIAIDKLKEKLEDVENQLKLEKNKCQELKSKVLLAEGKIIGDKEGYKREIELLQRQLTAKERKIEKIEREYLEKQKEPDVNLERKYDDDEKTTIKCEGKTINKFTLAARCSASPDSPSTDIEVNGLDTCRKLSLHVKCPFSISCDSTIEIPSLDVTSFADDIIEELELTEGSPRKKLDLEENEKNVTALTLRLLVHAKDISEKIEIQTEKYRYQYEEILNLIRDISHRLRDHVCIGTAEPIMPVFVLLEDIKLQLKEVVQSAGQVGVLVYEDKMKKCWNLVTNYMAMLRKETESLRNISSETTPTQTGLVRRRNKFTQNNRNEQSSPYKRRRFLSCTRLTTALLFVLAFSLTISIIIHLNCRMTASENQYCPLDGLITRINVGIPPM